MGVCGGSSDGLRRGPTAPVCGGSSDGICGTPGNSALPADGAIDDCLPAGWAFPVLSVWDRTFRVADHTSRTCAGSTFRVADHTSIRLTIFWPKQDGVLLKGSAGT